MGALFGSSVATAGDVNGDGYSDVIVGAVGYEDDQTAEGRAQIFLGSPTGLSASPSWWVDGNQDDPFFATRVATAGDVNGDGFSDVLIAAPYYNSGHTDEGKVFLYHGSASGPSASPDWTTESDQLSARLGYGLATAGDINGDGYDDVIVGIPYWDNGQADEGRVLVFHGSATGLPASPAWSYESDQANCQFGRSVAGAGDVNGDGFDDIIVGAHLYDDGESNEGRAFVFHGSAAGLGAAPAWIEESDTVDGHFGQCVSTAGDFDADGYADVIVGTGNYSNGEAQEGAVFVYRGSASGLVSIPTRLESNQAGARFGRWVSTAGDVDGDGYADIFVGAYGFDGTQQDEGRIFVFRGPYISNSTLYWTYDSGQSEAELGWCVATAGDVNGDGFSDLIAGADTFDGPDVNEGKAYVFHGGSKPPKYPTWHFWANGDNAQAGYAIAGVGDINGDGFDDFVMGAPGYDGSAGDAYTVLGSPSGHPAGDPWLLLDYLPGRRLGSAVGGAGDVNGDGYADILVSAPFHDGGEADEGIVYLWSGRSDFGEAEESDWQFEGNAAGALAGWSVSGAGDIDGDGISEVLIGAPGYGSGRGRVYCFRGGPGGLSASPFWVRDGAVVGDSLGTCVAAAGDVNRDGFADIAIGVRNHSTPGMLGRGRVEVYHGHPTGMSVAPDWIMEGAAADARFGHAVARAGDANGDGYGDLLVGAPGLGSGVGSLFLGSAGGLDAVAAWEVTTSHTGALLGFSVASAGDLDGNGTSDLLLGAPQYEDGTSGVGRAFAFFTGPALGGGATAEAADWSTPPLEGLGGFAVASAGDFGADGFSDILVGVPKYGEPASETGRVSIYPGNYDLPVPGDGCPYAARQLRAALPAPIFPLGISDTEGSFRLTSLARSPLGRTRVALEWEVKPLGALFDETGLQRSAAFLDTGSPQAPDGSAVSLTELVSGLDPDLLYHWRLRVVTRSPFLPRRPWVTLAYNGAEEADLRFRDSSVSSTPSGDDRALLAPRVSGAPNPFHGALQIEFVLPSPGMVNIDAFDAAGRRVSHVLGSDLRSGAHAIRWDARDAEGKAVPAGIYWIRLRHAGVSRTAAVVKVD